LCGAQRAAAQSLQDVLSFLLTNRSIVTDDFVRDQQAARATSDAISALLRVELGTLPTTTSAGGFIYRFDPELGVSVRVTDSFGAFFTERAMTAGSRQVTFGLSYRQASFNRIDGRSLRDGSLVSTASRLHGDSVPFDVETLTLRVRTDTVTALTNVGLTDRLDVGAALPVQRITLSGRRIDNYRGREATQAQADAMRTGPSDIVVQTKYIVVRRNASGIALAGVARLPTGDENNLLGAGRSAFIVRAIGSSEGQRTSLHGNLDYAVRGLSDELRYNGAITFVAGQPLTLVAEIAGRRLASIGQLATSVAPNPALTGVDTVRLTSINGPATRLMAVAGLKWNVRSSWLVAGNLSRSITDTGLSAGWTPSIAIDLSWGQ
jgi:hypothetical protein